MMKKIHDSFDSEHDIIKHDKLFNKINEIVEWINGFDRNREEARESWIQKIYMDHENKCGGCTHSCFEKPDPTGWICVHCINSPNPNKSNNYQNEDEPT